MLAGLLPLVLPACSSPPSASAREAAFGPLLPSGPLTLSVAAAIAPPIELDLPESVAPGLPLPAIEERLMTVTSSSAESFASAIVPPWHAAEQRQAEGALRRHDPDLMPGRYGLELFGRGRLQFMIGSQMMLENKMLDHLVLDPDEMDRNATQLDADVAVLGLRLQF
jgi:hypothetical protein